jgi:hypothetical protein
MLTFEHDGVSCPACSERIFLLGTPFFGNDKLEAYPTDIGNDKLEAYPTDIGNDKLEAYPTVGFPMPQLPP